MKIFRDCLVFLHFFVCVCEVDAFFSRFPVCCDSQHPVNQAVSSCFCNFYKNRDRDNRGLKSVNGAGAFSAVVLQRKRFVPACSVPLDVLGCGTHFTLEHENSSEKWIPTVKPWCEPPPSHPNLKSSPFHTLHNNSHSYTHTHTHTQSHPLRDSGISPCQHWFCSHRRALVSKGFYCWQRIFIKYQIVVREMLVL